MQPNPITFTPDEASILYNSLLASPVSNVNLKQVLTGGVNIDKQIITVLNKLETIINQNKERNTTMSDENQDTQVAPAPTPEATPVEPTPASVDSETAAPAPAPVENNA